MERDKMTGCPCCPVDDTDMRPEECGHERPMSLWDLDYFVRSPIERWVMDEVRLVLFGDREEDRDVQPGHFDGLVEAVLARLESKAQGVTAAGPEGFVKDLVRRLAARIASEIYKEVRAAMDRAERRSGAVLAALGGYGRPLRWARKSECALCAIERRGEAEKLSRATRGGAEGR